MSKMTRTKKVRKGIVKEVEKRNFTPAEVLELQEKIRLVNFKMFEAAQIKVNTALIPRGQEVAEETEAVARLLENAKNQWLNGKLAECGYDSGTKCNINLSTGEIVLTPDEPTDSK